MFPENCDGCYIYKRVNEKISTYECLAKEIPVCPCSNCIVKPICKSHDSCAKLVAHVLMYFPKTTDAIKINFLSSLSPTMKQKLLNKYYAMVYKSFCISGFENLKDYEENFVDDNNLFFSRQRTT